MSDDEKTNNNDAQHEQHDFEEVCLFTYNPIDRAYSEADRERLPFPAQNRRAPVRLQRTRCNARRSARTATS